jgi:hypothetical protein
VLMRPATIVTVAPTLERRPEPSWSLRAKPGA